MSTQRIRPSLADLASEYDQPAFPELEPDAVPAARVSRTRPPTVGLAGTTPTGLPPPIPVIRANEVEQEPVASTSTPATSATGSQGPAAKPKSRFALQREKEAAQRFELDLDGDGPEGEGGAEGTGFTTSAGDRFAQAAVVKGIKERPVGKKAIPPAPPSAPGPSRPSPLGARPTGFPAPARGVFPRKTTTPTPQPADAAGGLPVRSSDSSTSSRLTGPPSSDADALLQDVSRENEDVLRGMSEAEILEEQRQIREELGLSPALIKMLQSRGRTRAGVTGDSATAPKATPSPRSRPVPSGRPPIEQRQEVDEEEEEAEEGTPEYIRRHFFPNEPRNPDLEWMNSAQPRTSVKGSDSSGLVTINLQGDIIIGEAGVSASPSGMSGDHHVGSASTFTIPSLLSLTASSVPHQRSTAYHLLQRVIRYPDPPTLRLAPKELVALRTECVTRACHALRDSNVGVVTAAIGVIFAVCSVELDGTDDEDRKRPLPTSIAALLEANPFPRMAEHLSLGVLPTNALLDLLSTLSALVVLSATCEAGDAADAITLTPGLLDVVTQRFIATTWPVRDPGADDGPQIAATYLLTDLTRSSRTRAKVVAGQSFVESHLRFVALPPWDLEPKLRSLAYDLVSATFKLWSTLGRYGLATTLRTQAGDLLDAYGQRIADLKKFPEMLVTDDYIWISHYLELLSIWTTAAIDPHVTGHDITWSQVETWRDIAFDAHQLMLARLQAEREDPEYPWRGLAAAWELLGSWLEGSKTNKSWRGEHERRWIADSLGHAFEKGQAVHKAVMTARQQLAKDGDQTAARVVASALRLCEAQYEQSDPPTDHLLALGGGEAAALVQLAARGCRSPAVMAVLEYALRRVPRPDRLALIALALPLLTPAEAVIARDLVGEVLTTVVQDAKEGQAVDAPLDPEERSALAEVGALQSFITHAIVTASGGRVVGPVYPTARDIKLTACLAPFAPTAPLLRADWPLSVLDELLRSADSLVLQHLPHDWNVSEVQLVRSALVLTRVILDKLGGEGIAATALVYDLIKVFMLEKDNSGSVTGTSGAEREVFRDSVVQRSLSALLQRLRVAQPSDSQQNLRPDARTAKQTLEGVSAQISSAPFFQLYQDLVGLYDSISLSDRNFGVVLLPPLAMAYPVDYRRLIWTDFAHLLPHLSFSLEEAISDVEDRTGALSAYLEPRETSAPLLMAYVEALVTSRVTADKTPFLHLVAVHHVSRAIFSGAAPETEKARMAQRLAKTIAAKASDDLTATVVNYRQVEKEAEALRLPPDCFEQSPTEARQTAFDSLVKA